MEGSRPACLRVGSDGGCTAKNELLVPDAANRRRAGAPSSAGGRRRERRPEPKYVTLGPVVDGLRVITQGLTPTTTSSSTASCERGQAQGYRRSNRAPLQHRPPARKSTPIEREPRCALHFFIDRPIFAAVVSIVFVIVGAVSVGRLPVAQYPEIAPPVGEGPRQYPGASADVVAATVVAPLEQQITTASRT